MEVTEHLTFLQLYVRPSVGLSELVQIDKPGCFVIGSPSRGANRSCKSWSPILLGVHLRLSLILFTGINPNQ